MEKAKYCLKSLREYLFVAAFLFPVMIISGFAAQASGFEFGAGNLEGKESVDQGRLTYGLSLILPPGARGLRPDLAVKYRQGGSNGIMGMAFSLSGLSSVARCAASQKIDGFSGGVAFTGQDRYCLGGQRLIAVKGEDGADGSEYRFRHNTGTKIVLYGQAESASSYWKVWRDDGYILEYGKENQSLETIDGKVASWRISSRRDRFGNKLDYRYKNEDGFVYPDYIEYSGYKVKFAYEAREDKSIKYRLGKEAALNKRLARIEIRAGEALIRDYRLGYDSLNKDNPRLRRSLLKSVQLCGSDGKCLAPLKFSYKETPVSGQSGTVQKELFILPLSLFSLDLTNYNYTAGDMNRDGLNDICLRVKGEGLLCALNKGNYEFGPLRKWTDKLKTSHWNDLKTISTLSLRDINRDGWPDYSLVDDFGLWAGLHNKNNGFIEYGYLTRKLNAGNKTALHDFNRDRLPDLHGFLPNGVRMTVNSGNFYTGREEEAFPGSIDLTGAEFSWPLKTRVSGYVCVDGRARSWPDHDTFPELPRPRRLDINNDGWPDICGFRDDEGYHCLEGKGVDKGGRPLFGPLRKWASHFPYGSARVVRNCSLSRNEHFPVYWKRKTEQFKRTFRLADLNGDGLADMCYRSGDSYVCRVNNGKEFLPAKTWLSLSGGEWSDNLENWRVPNKHVKPELMATESSIILEDRDGDGLADFSVMAGGTVSCPYDGELPELCSLRNRALKTAVNLDGKFNNYHSELVFSSGSIFKKTADLDGDGKPELCYWRNGFECVFSGRPPVALLKETTNSWGKKTGFEYARLSDSAVYSTDGSEDTVTPSLPVVKAIESDNGIRGLNRVEFFYRDYKIDLKEGGLGFREIERLDRASGITTVTEYSRQEPFTGKILKTSRKLGQRVIREASYQYGQAEGIHPQVKPVALKSSEETSRGLLHELLTRRLTVYSGRDVYGRPGKIEVSVSGADGKVWKTITKSSYLTDGQRWLFSGPTSVSVTSQAPETPDIVRATAFAYAAQTGVLIRKTSDPGHDLSLAREFFYDQSGHLIKTIVSDKNGRQRVTETPRDSLGRPTDIINALGHKASFKYHPVCGLPETRTDPNGLTTSWEYDGFCRQTKVTAPDGLEAGFVYRRGSGGAPNGEQTMFGVRTTFAAVGMVERSDGAGGWSRYHYDSLGRKIRSAALGDNGKKIFQDTIYNAQGRVAAVSPPYFEGAFPSSEDNWTTSRYDDLGRLVERKKPFKNTTATTSINYLGMKTTAYFTDGRGGTEERNAAGKTVSVQENNDSLIEYKYDALGRPTESVANGYAVKTGYYLTGAKKWMEDPAAGRVEYSYNAFGELFKQKDARGQTIGLTYDVLGRLIRRAEPEGESRWIYDKNGKVGKLNQATGPEASRTYEYDQYGRPEKETLQIGGREFAADYQYDEAGRLAATVHDNTLTVLRSYDSSGRLKKVEIPKSSVWGYDYQQLTESLKEILTRILELEQEATGYEEKAKKYADKAAWLRHQADQWLAKSDSLSQEASQLRTSAESLAGEAAALQNVALDYREKSAFYWKAFGNNYLTYQKTAGGKAYYKNTSCVKRNWKGHCKKRNSFRAYIPEGLIPDERTCVTTYSWKRGRKTTCSWGPKRHLHLGRFYAGLANSYDKSSEVKTKEAEGLEASADEKEESAQDSRKTADSLLAQAETYSRLAQEQTNLLKKTMAELEEQRAARDDLQAKLDSFNSLDGETLVLWTAGERDAAGRLKKEIFGNNMVVDREFEPHDGRLKRIAVGNEDGLVRDLNYDYYANGNVRERRDPLSGAAETFQYDLSGRLTRWEREDSSGEKSRRSYYYDVRGNMGHVAGSDGDGTRWMDSNDDNRMWLYTGGDMSFHTYRHDKNGNRTKGGGRTFSWTSFNKIRAIENGGGKIEFGYGPDRRRVFKKTGAKTVYYARPDYELTEEKDAEGRSLTRMRHYIFAAGRIAAVYEKNLADGEKRPDRIAYLHRNALGSVDTVTDGEGEVVLKNRFAPFGERLETEQPEKELFKADELRGYTGHEHIAEAGLINMNGRVYDPKTARFLSPDPYVLFPHNSQSHNRYSYVLNNPLKYADPSGYFPKWLADPVGEAEKGLKNLVSQDPLQWIQDSLDSGARHAQAGLHNLGQSAWDFGEWIDHNVEGGIENAADLGTTVWHKGLDKGREFGEYVSEHREDIIVGATVVFVPGGFSYVAAYYAWQELTPEQKILAVSTAAGIGCSALATPAAGGACSGFVSGYLTARHNGANGHEAFFFATKKAIVGAAIAWAASDTSGYFMGENGMGFDKYGWADAGKAFLSYGIESGATWEAIGQASLNQAMSSSISYFYDFHFGDAFYGQAPD